MPAGIMPGSYQLDFSGMIYLGIYYTDATNFLISASGTITIISNNLSTKRISGKFDFNAQKSGIIGTVNNLTNGYFSVKLSAIKKLRFKMQLFYCG